VQYRIVKGISGVAPNCKIIPIRAYLGTNYPTSYLADAVDLAVLNGADIINHSWSGGGNVTAVTAAIYNATTNGRGGKGCVFVNSAGNGDALGIGTAVAFPAYLPTVIAVGAIDRDGARAGFSNYGNDLNLVAPGVDIWTTSISGTNYGIESGTSFAAPHVAGVAALVLSAYPQLHQVQVRQAIESTCQKINSSIYTYSTTSGHPNGTWDTQVGHGLIDAYAAINIISTLSARTVNLGFHYNSGPSGATVSCSGEGTSGYTFTSSGSQNYSAPSYSALTISQNVSVGSGYCIYLDEDPRGDCVVTGEGTNNMTVTYYLPISSVTVNSLILKFIVQTS
jgi:Subtilisin-like serine proteases